MMEKQSVVVEEYLQSIYRIGLNGEPVKSSVLAQRLEATPSTVHATISRMQRDGLINIGEKKQILLTKKGRKQAEEIVSRHNLAEHFLCNTLGIPWYEVHKHAHLLEHAMTPLVTQKLAEFLDYPSVCPHGTPMPGAEGNLPKNAFSLDSAESEMTVEVIRIDESLEDSEDLLKHLHDRNIIPGKQHYVLERLDSLHSLTLKHGDSQASLPFDIAEKITVIPVGS